jgi:uncharacterized protein YjiK
MMLWIQIILIAASLAAPGCAPRPAGPAGAGAPELELVAAYAVEGRRLVEPSGLTLHDGVLYTVADKDDGVIFRIGLEAGVARLVPHIRFDPPESGTMDWEGITVDKGGTFYLISERRGRLLRVTADGTASWASPDLRAEGRRHGLFNKVNAGFEGVAWLGPNHWLGAVEREPRGLVEWRGGGEAVAAEYSVREDSPFKDALPLLRIPDYAGLYADRGTVYGLFRNAHLVVRLEKAGGAWRETAAWSYRHLETDPRWAYRAQAYGQAEGLVVDGRDVYLIFDNNLGARQADPRDRRPLLIHARMPDPE